MTSIKNC